MKLHRGFSLRREIAGNTVRPENDFVESPAFEHHFVHFPVAPVVAALSAGGIHNDFSARFTRSGIDLHTAMLQRKGSVNRVQRTAERPMHRALRRIDLEGKRTARRGLRRGMLRQGD